MPSNRVQVLEDRVDISLTDGGIGDDDGVVNGSISDPGGFAKVVATGDTAAACGDREGDHSTERSRVVPVRRPDRLDCF